MAAEAERLTALRDRLWSGIHARVPDVRLSGHPIRRLPGTASLLFRHVESESLVLGLDLKGIGVSAAPASTPRHVNACPCPCAEGAPPACALAALRCLTPRSPAEQ